MSNATRVTIATYGVLAGLAGIEHGIGEILQGNRAPDGMVIKSWPESEAFRIVNGEPAMTIVPNVLITGILAIIVSLIFMVWAIKFAERKHGGLVLLLLSLVLLLVGGGFGPPLLGIILSGAATRINAPLRWRRTHLAPASQRVLSQAWPWLLVVGVIAWLLVMPGSILIDHVLGMMIPDLAMFALIFSAFALLLLTIVTALARDVEQLTDVQHAPARSAL